MAFSLYSTIVSVLFTTVCYASPEILYENSTCYTRGLPGVCLKLQNCDLANDDVNNYGQHNYTRCSFENFTEIVCCPDSLDLRITLPSTRKSEKVCAEYVQSSSAIVFPQIADGQNVDAGEFPFMAALAFYDKEKYIYNFDCGGTLISERNVLTAAHCLWNPNESEVSFVRLGVIYIPWSVNEMDPALDYTVKNYTIHPQYTRRYQYNDIAILEMTKSIQFKDNLRPACLFSNGVNYPENYIIIGWGEVNNDGVRRNILQKAYVDFVDLDRCSQRYARIQRPLQSAQLCAAHIKSDTCRGDSGGPLIIRKSDFPIVVGITSFGLSGCGGGSPSVYTSISKYLEWIEKIVWTQ